MKRVTVAALILLSFLICIVGRGGAQTRHQSKRVVSKPTPQQIAARALSAVVSIRARDPKGDVIKSGSGFFISGQMVVTNYHVVKGADSIRVNAVTDTNTD